MNKWCLRRSNLRWNGGEWSHASKSEAGCRLGSAESSDGDGEDRSSERKSKVVVGRRPMKTPSLSVLS